MQALDRRLDNQMQSICAENGCQTTVALFALLFSAAPKIKAPENNLRENATLRRTGEKMANATFLSA